MERKRIGILTSGGDCPGLNAVLRAASRASEKLGWELIGFQDGFEGLLAPATHVVLNRRATAGMDSDGFTCACSVRGDTAVFLIHVPDLRKFNEEAQVAMGQWSWAAARVGWSQLPEPRPAKLAVALKGIALYDRLLTGAAKPLNIADDDAEVTDAILQAGIDSTITKASDITKALEEIFTEPASLSSKQDSKADSKQDPKPDQKPDPAPASNP